MPCTFERDCFQANHLEEERAPVGVVQQVVEAFWVGFQAGEHGRAAADLVLVALLPMAGHCRRVGMQQLHQVPGSFPNLLHVQGQGSRSREALG